MLSISVFFLSFSAAFVAVPFARRLALYIGAVDRPSQSKIHEGIVPRCGGLAVIAGLVCACAFAGWAGGPSCFTCPASFLLGAASILALGVWDDVAGLGPRSKLCVQLLAASMMFVGGVHAGAFVEAGLPFLVDYSLTVFWFLLLINGLNLIDGLDGLAGGISIVAALGLAGTCAVRGLSSETVILIALAGSMLGFLPYNLVRAKVFLGDTGSMFSGFVLATASLAACGKGDFLSAVGVPILILGLPILDTALCCWRRGTKVLLSYVLAQERPPGILSRDLEHIHHRLLREYGTHGEVTGRLCLASATVALIGLACINLGDIGLALFATMLAGLVVIVSRLAEIEIRGTKLLVVQMMGRQSRPELARAVYSMLALSAFSASWAAAASLSGWDAEMGFTMLGWTFYCAIPSGLLVFNDSRRGYTIRRMPEVVAAFTLLVVFSALTAWQYSPTGLEYALSGAILFAIFSSAAAWLIREGPSMLGQSLRGEFEAQFVDENVRLSTWRMAGADRAELWPSAVESEASTRRLATSGSEDRSGGLPECQEACGLQADGSSNWLPSDPCRPGLASNGSILGWRQSPL